MLPYFEFIVGFSVLDHVLNMYLDMRQWLKFRTKEVPVPLQKYVTKEEFINSQEYNLAKSSFGIISSTFSFCLDILVLWYGILPLFWEYSLQAIQLVGLSESNHIIRSLLFFFISQYVRTVILLPFSLYSVFVIEERFGFNKQTLGGFFLDHVKGLGLGIVFGAPIAAGFILVVEWGGEYFWFYTWLFVVFVSLLMTTIYPTVIAPIFNKFTELEEGELREKIEALATRVNFPLTKLYKIDGSTRSAHSNAYFFGFFKNKRIVLYDTLMSHASNDDIVAIVGHELGHWKLNHTLKNMIILFVYMLSFFYMFGFFLNHDDLSRSFGFLSNSTLISFTLFCMLYEPVDHFMSLIMHYLSRKYEYQADEYATELGFDLTEGLVAIHKKNARENSLA